MQTTLANLVELEYTLKKRGYFWCDECRKEVDHTWTRTFELESGVAAIVFEVVNMKKTWQKYEDLRKRINYMFVHARVIYIRNKRDTLSMELPLNVKEINVEGVENDVLAFCKCVQENFTAI